MAPLATDGADQGVAVRGEGEGAVDDLPDAGVGVDGEVLEADGQRRCDPLQVGGEQLGAEVPRGLADRPRHTGLLVGTEQQATGLGPGVDLAAEVHRADAVAVGGVQPRLDLRQLLGEQVHVLHGQDGQFQAEHAPHLAGPQAAAVDDVLAGDGAPLGDHVPLAVGPVDDVAGPRVAVDLGPGHAGRRGIGVGHARRVDVAAHRVPQGTHEVLLDDEGDLLGRFGHRDQLGLHAQVAAPGVGHAEPVHAVGVVGQHHLAGQVQAARYA